MTESIAPHAKHREHIQQRTEFVRGKRGPVSFVWGNHVEKRGQRVPGAPGLWSPLPKGEAGLLVEASASDGIVIDGHTVDGSAKLAAEFNYATPLPCSFSRAWNCPIPPLENRLRVPIEAGERFAVDRDGVPLL